MTQLLHKIILTFYVLVIIIALVALIYFGYSYYKLPIVDRSFHPYYDLLKPSGLVGHGLGITGTFLILVGLFGYMTRKRVKMFSRVGVLKYWLELHIFLCTLGAIFVLFHTSFKFGGVVAIGFWSLALVWLSGVAGRFLYLQIPHSIEGRELGLSEVQELKSNFDNELMQKYKINFSEIKTSKFSQIKLKLISKQISKKDFRKVNRLIKKQRILVWRIERLERMKNIFKFWHFIHLPFALIMIIIMVIHVSIVLFFGYKWIF